jgi:pterin-4a-carbinolamine dehydratase
MSQVVQQPHITQRLKSERVQEALGAGETGLKSERVQEMLAAMPDWTFLPPAGEAINRVFRLPSERVASTFADYFTAYAEALGHKAYLEFPEESVVDVTLIGTTERGRCGPLTEEIVAFAEKFG